MRSITKYVANDGTEFIDQAKCEAYEALIAEVAALMAKLPPLPNDDGCNFSNGDGYIQHDPALFTSVRADLLRIAQRYWKHDWLQQSIDKGNEVDASWAGRIISEGCPRPISDAWYRITCTNRISFREYGQPYYASHESEAKQIQRNTDHAR